MIYAIIGPNRFGMREKLREILDKEGFAKSETETLEAEDLSKAELIERLSSQSLFSEQRAFVVRSASQNKALAEDLSETFDQIPQDSCVIFYEPEIDKRGRFFKALKKLPKFNEMKELAEPELISWLQDLAKKQDVKLSRSQAAKIVDMVGPNQQLIASEFSKLADIGGEITDQTVVRVINANPRESIFELLDDLASGDVQKSLEMYRNLRFQQMEPAYILSMMVWHTHNLLLIKSTKSNSEQEIVQSTKLSPFVVRKNKKIAQALSMQDFRKLYRDIILTDSKLKSSPVDPDLLMEQLLTKISRLF